MATTRTDLIIHNRITGAITRSNKTAQQYTRHNNATMQPEILDGEQCYKLIRQGRVDRHPPVRLLAGNGRR